MGIISIPPLVQRCPNCGLQPEKWTNDCPRCGKTIMSPERMRYYGRGMITIGAMGIVMVTIMMLAASRTFLRGEDLGGLAILGSVQVFCMVCIGSGVSLIRTGRQNITIAYTLIGLMGVILLLALFYHNSGS